MKLPFKARAEGLWVTVSVLTVLAVTIWLSVKCWDWLNGPTSPAQSNADTVRAIALVLGGVIAVILTLWRSRIAERQANAAQDQSKTAQLGLRNERYQKGAEMLGSKILTVRLGGIYALRRLAEEHPQEYHVQIMRLFCAFARRPTDEPTLMSDSLLDVDAVMEAIALRSKVGIELEKCNNFHLDLRRAKGSSLLWENFENVDLHGANLAFAALPGSRFHPRTDLSGINGYHANLLDSTLVGVNLCGAKLLHTNLENAFLNNANLSRTIFQDAILTGADLRGACGLTQAQLDSARAELNIPPNLEGLLDAETGKPLIWRGGLYTPPGDLSI